MTAFLRGLLELSLLGSALAALLLALGPALRRRAPAAAYYLWLLVLLRLCVPAGLTLPIPVPAETAPPPAVSAPAIQPDIPAAGGASTDRPEAEPSASLAPSAPPAEDTAPETPAAASGVRWSWPAVLTAVWAAGFALCLGRYAVGYLRFSRALRPTLRPADGRAEAALRALCPSGAPRLAVSPHVPGPLLLGVLRPVIVLPPGVEEPDRLPDILRHELTHARRRDLLYKWFAALATSAHWFNPLMPLVRRELNRACELSCDAAAVRGMAPAERRHYGETLLALAAAPPRGMGLLATTLCEEKARLKERLMFLAKGRRRGPAAAALATAAALLLTSCALFRGAEAVPTASPESTPAAPGLLEDAQLYEVDGLTLALPADSSGRRSVVTETNTRYILGEFVLLVCETESYETGRREELYPYGVLFTLLRYPRANYEAALESGQTPGAIARDEDYYYVWQEDPNRRLYRSGGEEKTWEEESWWAEQVAALPAVQADFISRNGLEPFDEAAFLRGRNTYEGEHRYLDYNGADGVLSLTLSQPVRQGAGGIWCVERWCRPDGTVGLNFDQEGETPSEEIYARRQEAADRDGASDYLTAEGAALLWLRDYLGDPELEADALLPVEAPVTVREGWPTLSATLGQLFSQIDYIEFYGFKEPGSGPGVNELSISELGQLREWFGACTWEVTAETRSGYPERGDPPSGCYTLYLVGPSNLAMHWGEPYVYYDNQIWHCIDGYEELYTRLAGLWEEKTARNFPEWVRSGDPDREELAQAVESLSWAPGQPAPEGAEGVTVRSGSGRVSVTFYPGNLVYYYQDRYWNYWFQGTGDAELYSLAAEQSE